MKSNLLNTLMLASKFAFRMFLLQLVGIQLLVANPLKSQELRDVKISINVHNVSIDQVFSVIEKQSNFVFSFTDEVRDASAPISMSFASTSIYDVLYELAKREGLRFKRINNNVTVVKSKKKFLKKDWIKELDRTIQGKVTESESSEPLIGATVRIKGTSIGAITDVDGSFSISIPDNAEVLEVSYIGFITKSIEIGNQTRLEITLEADVSALEEVVVVGYGTQDKINLTGSVTQVNGENVNKRPITQTSQALQGLAPGVFINTKSGEPGNDDASIVIRGIGTLNNANPLVLVDGIEAPINSVNPIDIESINVLKDAASASIYGTRAANGVILITTKRGSKGKPQISYDGYYSITSPTILPDMVYDNRTYLETYRRAAEYSGRNNIVTDQLIDEYAAIPSTDYLDLYVGNGSTMNHNVSISGGTDNLKYRWSTGYLDNESYLSGDFYATRLSNRLTLDFDINEKVRLGTVLAYVNEDNRLTSKQDNNNRDLLLSNGNSFSQFTNKGSFYYTAIIMNDPHVRPFDEFGRIGGLESGTGRSERYNPNGIRDNEWINVNGNDFLGNAFLEFEPLERLKFRYTTGISTQQESFEETRLQWTQWDRFGNQTSTRNQGNLLRTRESNIVNFTNWIQASYNVSLANHNFNFLVGANQETSEIRRIAIYENDFGSTSLVSAGNSSTADVANFNGEWALASYFSRINYDFDDRYLLEFNFRRDGSSRFGSNSRWANFPGISAGYLVSNESFWNVGLIDLLKLRASWGRIGVQSQNLYPFASQFTLGADYNGNSGGALNVLGNQNLQWEETTTVDFGIDVGFLEGRIGIEADYFVKESNDILTDLENPLTSGVSSDISVNAASIRNEGWEVALRLTNDFGPLRVSAGFNVTHVQNEILTINPELTNSDDRIQVDASSNIWWIRGEAINAIYGHEFGGVFQTEEFNDDGSLRDGTDYSWVGTPRPGDIKYTDQNGDRRIDEEDMVIIGNRNPEWLYGFNFDFEYEGFDLSLLFQGIGRADAYISRYTGNFGHAGLRSYYLDGWTEQNPSNEIPRIWVDRDGFNGNTIGGNGGLYSNSFWVQNRAYLRMKNISLGYTLPQSVLANTPVNYLRVYVSGQNLWTMTDLVDLDPERVDNEHHFTAALPQAKAITFGLNVKF